VAEYWIDKRYELLSSEKGTIQKVDIALRIALCYPNSYFVGMSNLGFHTAYRYFNRADESKAERAFYENGSRPFTIETGRALNDFHAIGFSCSFELDYENVLRMLSLSKIPLYRRERSRSHPLIFLGGFTTFFNFAPLEPFVDFILVGESEPLFAPVCDILIQYAKNKVSKTEALRALSLIDGLYVPERNNTISLQSVPTLDTSDTSSCIVTPHTEFNNTFLIEIARGCYHGCKFCVSGHAYSSIRTRSIDTVKSMCERVFPYTKRIGFIASAPSDYPWMPELIEYIETNTIDATFSSLRASSIDERLLKLFARHRKKTLTLAPETGSERLRTYIGKNIMNNTFYEVARNAKKHGFQKIKLYIMIGLPGEEAIDREQTVSFIDHISKILPLRISMTPFIPKPKTPFGNCYLLDRRALKEHISFYKKSLSKNSIRLRFDGIRLAEKQALYAKGDEHTLTDFAASLT
jgi:radical SAM superfamily enzyme YgiQ (UPF0313 family)